jgi:hypothetical protein
MGVFALFWLSTRVEMMTGSLKGRRCENPHRRNEGARTRRFPEIGVFAPPSPLFKKVEYVRETEILVEQQPPQGVFLL